MAPLASLARGEVLPPTSTYDQNQKGIRHWTDFKKMCKEQRPDYQLGSPLVRRGK